MGLAVVSVAVLWLATRPSLSPQARIQDVGEAEQKMEDETRGTSIENLELGIENLESRIQNRASSIEHRASSIVQSERTRPQRFHVVRDGETLSEISYAYYGSAVKWRRIFEANRKTIKNANVVMPGTKLIIPN